MSLARIWSTFQLLHLSQPAGQRVLYKAVRRRHIQSVLEVNVGDGTRCTRLIAWLRQQGCEGAMRYAAIDLFELGGTGAVGLKAFHQQLSRQGVKPLPVPGTLPQGLPRVAHTLGAVDLAILDVDPQQLCEAATSAMLPRILRPDSLVLIRGARPQSLQLIDAASLLSQSRPVRAAA